MKFTVINAFSRNLFSTAPQKLIVSARPFCGLGGINVTIVTKELSAKAVSWTMLTTPLIETNLLGVSETIVEQSDPWANATVTKLLVMNSLATFPQKVILVMELFCGIGGIKVTTVTSELLPELVALLVSRTALTNPLIVKGVPLLSAVVSARCALLPHPSRAKRSRTIVDFTARLLRRLLFPDSLLLRLDAKRPLSGFQARATEREKVC